MFLGFRLIISPASECEFYCAANRTALTDWLNFQMIFTNLLLPKREKVNEINRRMSEKAKAKCLAVLVVISLISLTYWNISLSKISEPARSYGNRNLSNKNSKLVNGVSKISHSTLPPFIALLQPKLLRLS